MTTPDPVTTPDSAASTGSAANTDPALGSLLLASPDPDALRDWYQRVLGAWVNGDGFLQVGDVALLFDRRDDVADRNPEPGRVILNFDVADAHAAAESARAAGAVVEVEPEWREQGWFVTALDPDGNRFQLIQMSADYFTSRGLPVPPRALDADASPLARGHVETRLPAQDLDRARSWYADKLGLEPYEERAGGLRYACGGTFFALFASGGAPSGAHTQMGWTVDDLDGAVEGLRARGVAFEDDDLPGLTSVDGVVEIPGGYPSERGTGERAAWFHDSEGNLVGLRQVVR